MKNFNPTRLEFVRKYRGISQKKTADDLNIKVPMYRRYEKGDKEPNERMVTSFSRYFDFPKGWFFKDDIKEIDPRGCSLYF